VERRDFNRKILAGRKSFLPRPEKAEPREQILSRIIVYYPLPSASDRWLSRAEPSSAGPLRLRIQTITGLPLRTRLPIHELCLVWTRTQ